MYARHRIIGKAHGGRSHRQRQASLEDISAHVKGLLAAPWGFCAQILGFFTKILGSFTEILGFILEELALLRTPVVLNIWHVHMCVGEKERERSRRRA